MKIPAPLRTPVFFLLLALLLYVLAVNAKALYAELYAMGPRHLLGLQDDRQWRERDTIYADALVMTETLLDIQPGNPEYQEMRGRLLINRCQHWDMTEQWDAWQQCQRDAQASLRHVVRDNPQWPYGWANLLLTKYNLRQFDDEFYRALERCRQLGASEMAVNRVVAFIGLQEWQRWRSELRPQIREAFLALNAVAPYQAAQLAHDSHQDFLYCLWTDAPDKHKSCIKKLPQKNQ
ncbi:MAG TPA: hypothetical protein PLF22_05230 [Pseudomonadales bacterium]|nr:hypothetical protein [Pseudomonadales bacterium]